MSRRGPEGKIQDAVIKYARTKYGALCKKNEVGRFFVGSGWPDYMVLGTKPFEHLERYISNGVPMEDTVIDSVPVIFFIEFKGPGKVPTALQENTFAEIRARGFKVHVISSTEAGKKIIDAECA